MAEIATQNPQPPSEEIPTEVPLGISSVLDKVPMPMNIVPTPEINYDTSYEIFLQKFTISNTDITGRQLFNWSSQWPLGNFANPYNTISAVGWLNWNVPWSLVTAFYSRQVQIDWILKFTPIKVSDCRATMDFVVQYNGAVLPIPYNTRTTNNDLFHWKIDSQDQAFSIAPSQFWMTNNVQTDTMVYHLGTSRGTLNPGFLPMTTVTGFLVNRYQNNLMQPDQFEVIVTLVPIVRNIIGFSGKSNVRTILGLELENQTPRPYFLTKAIP